MTGCRLCPRTCPVDRSFSVGVCGVGEGLKVGAVVIHRGEEPPLVTGSGSGSVFFSGCPLKCSYCQNRQISHDASGRSMTPQELSRFMIILQEQGCSNINLVSPTHVAPAVFHALDHARACGLHLPIIVNSSGYESTGALKVWTDRAGIFLMDLKYGDNETGSMLSKVRDYWDRAREAVAFLWETVGPLRTDQGGSAVSGLIVRHLVLPGMRSNPFAVFEFLAELSTDIPLSIMSQYNPGFYRGDIPDMHRLVSRDEYDTVLERASDLGFTTIFAQDMDAASIYAPDFLIDTPFGDCRRIF